jgi:predicted transcriptional regulator of viral defense system
MSDEASSPGVLMPRAHPRWFEEALVVGSLLAPEGAAAYDTAMRWWGWPREAPVAESGATGGDSAAGGDCTACLSRGPSDAGPRLVRFITPKRKQAMHPVLFGVRFELVFVKAQRMAGAELLGEPGLRVRVTCRERTLIDIVDRSDLCGGVPAVAALLPRVWSGLDLERLTGLQEQFGGGTVPRRLGYLAERLGLLPPDDPLLERWRELIGSGYSLLERGGEPRGRFVRRWGLRDNVPELEGLAPG